MKFLLPAALVLSLGTVACHHSQDTRTDAQKEAADEQETVDAIRTRAAFDLNCEAAQVQVVKIADGSFTAPATYGATCGEKRATYLQRMGTIIRQ